MSNTNVLIFVEDPGAANCLSQLPSAMAERGWSVRLLAAGHAKDHLLNLGVSFETVDCQTTASEILLSAEPHLLIVGTARNPDTLGLALVEEARKIGITNVGVVDAPMQAEYRFRGRSNNPLAYAPDWLVVTDDWTKRIYSSLGYPVQHIGVCGAPHYDYVRGVRTQLAQENINAVKRRVLPEATENQKVIVFASEGSARLTLPPMERQAEYTLTGRGTSKGRTEIVIEEFLNAVQLIEPMPYLVLRLHPKDIPDDYSAYKNEFNLFSYGGSPFELIYVSDLVVGLTTTLLLETVLLGKLALSVVPRAEEMNHLPNVRAGITKSVSTRKELISVLPALLSDNSQILPTNGDGIIPSGCLQRTVDFIEGLLKCVETTQEEN